MHKKINYYFLAASILLISLGILFLANLSAPASLRVSGNTNYYLFKQLFALCVGLVLALVAYKIPLQFVKKVIPFILGINILLLIALFFPVIGVEHWGASRWINIGGFSLQPSELLKITSVLFLSAWLSNRVSEKQVKGFFKKAKDGYSNFVSIFLPILFFLAIISAILLFQKDLGTLGIVVTALLAVYFVAGTPLWHTILLVVTGILGALVFIKIEPYRMQRLIVFLNPEADPLGIGFQLRQSLLAIGSGGIFGKGWGLSVQKFGSLPQAMTDSMFAILGEETGIIGCVILVSLFVFFFWHGIRIAKEANNRFSKMAATGIMTWLVIQSFMNIASTIGLFPLTGIPLPFFSYGGTHLIAELVGIGILLNISKNG